MASSSTSSASWCRYKLQICRAVCFSLDYNGGVRRESSEMDRTKFETFFFRVSTFSLFFLFQNFRISQYQRQIQLDVKNGGDFARQIIEWKSDEWVKFSVVDAFAWETFEASFECVDEKWFLNDFVWERRAFFCVWMEKCHDDSVSGMKVTNVDIHYQRRCQRIERQFCKFFCFYLAIKRKVV